MSIRLRLALWFSGLMAIALTAFGAGALWLHTRGAEAQFDAELTNLGATVAQVMREELGESGNLHHAVRETQESVDVADRAIAILDVDGHPLAAHWHGFDGAGLFPPPHRSQRPEIATIAQTGGAWRVLQRPERSPAGDYTIVIAGPLSMVATQQALLARVLVLAGSIIILATAIVSWWVASSALRPVRTMASEAAALSAKAPHWRLNAPSDTDELGQLARAFNDLLARLGTASRTQRQFMADASHELRTPVSVIQTATEVTLSLTTRQEPEYREALTIIGEQTARLSRMVQDMFVLARADAGGYQVPMRRLYVDEVVAEAVRAVAVVAAAKGLNLTSELDADVAIDGEDGLLHRMVTNLLDNAVQHTPAGGGGQRRPHRGRGDRDDRGCRYRTWHSRRRSRPSFRSLRPARSGPFCGVGRRTRASDRSLDCRTASRHAVARAVGARLRVRRAVAPADNAPPGRDRTAGRTSHAKMNVT
jgi:HAMP domain-containing protein